MHELLSTVIGMLAESKNLERTARARTARGIADLAERPREPQITDEHLCDGSWAALMVAHVAPHSGDFAAFLGNAAPPNHPRLTVPSASERLEAPLRGFAAASHRLLRL